MSEAFAYPPGHVIPGTKYRAIRKLGAGGMGTVYEVEDITIGKRFVMKTLLASLAARPDLAERMLREARALGRLHHPNIVEVITADVIDDSLKLPYYVMERLSGHNLRTFLDNRGPLEPELACRFAHALSNALHHAHEQRIVHRDVKPENIFLHRAVNGDAVLKLLDFGVFSDADKATISGNRFIGTLRYAAPEQLLGHKVTPQTDLYAAGLVLYEMLAGRSPFEGEGHGVAIGRAHLEKPPPPLSQFRAVDPTLERLVMHALAKDPLERPLDALTFGAEINRVRKRLGGRAPLASTTDHATAEDIFGPNADFSSARRLVSTAPVADPRHDAETVQQGERRRGGAHEEQQTIPVGTSAIQTTPQGNAASQAPTPRISAAGGSVLAQNVDSDLANARTLYAPLHPDGAPHAHVVRDSGAPGLDGGTPYPRVDRNSPTLTSAGEYAMPPRNPLPTDTIRLEHPRQRGSENLLEQPRQRGSENLLELPASRGEAIRSTVRMPSLAEAQAEMRAAMERGALSPSVNPSAPTAHGATTVPTRAPAPSTRTILLAFGIGALAVLLLGALGGSVYWMRNAPGPSPGPSASSPVAPAQPVVVAVDASIAEKASDGDDVAITDAAVNAGGGRGDLDAAAQRPAQPPRAAATAPKPAAAPSFPKLVPVPSASSSPAPSPAPTPAASFTNPRIAVPSGL